MNIYEIDQTITTSDHKSKLWYVNYYGRAKKANWQRKALSPTSFNDDSFSLPEATEPSSSVGAAVEGSEPEAPVWMTTFLGCLITPILSSAR